LKARKPPKGPQDLLDHRLLTFSHWKPENSWTFIHKNGIDKETLIFQPHFSMNDYTGLAPRGPQGPRSGSFRPSLSPGLSGKAILSRSCPTGGSAPTTSRSSKSGTVTSPSHAGSSRISRCRWRQVCFPSCRSERLTANSAVPIGHHEQRQVLHFTSAAAIRDVRLTSKLAIQWGAARPERSRHPRIVRSQSRNCCHLKQERGLRLLLRQDRRDGPRALSFPRT
jgi:hypothetical protein